jgi:hypothetical protein
MDERESKRHRSSEVSDRIQIGDEVRLVNLPAYPGLEGLTGKIVGLDEKSMSVDVELYKNKAIKRVWFRAKNFPYYFLAQTRKSQEALHRSAGRVTRPRWCIQTERTVGGVH